MAKYKPLFRAGPSTLAWGLALHLEYRLNSKPYFGSLDWKLKPHTRFNKEFQQVPKPWLGILVLSCGEALNPTYHPPPQKMTCRRNWFGELLPPGCKLQDLVLKREVCRGIYIYIYIRRGDPNHMTKSYPKRGYRINSNYMTKFWRKNPVMYSLTWP